MGISRPCNITEAKPVKYTRKHFRCLSFPPCILLKSSYFGRLETIFFSKDYANFLLQLTMIWFECLGINFKERFFFSPNPVSSSWLGIPRDLTSVMTSSLGLVYIWQAGYATCHIRKLIKCIYDGNKIHLLGVS